MNKIIQKIESSAKIALHFSGTVQDSFLLKKLLEDTQCELVVYYFTEMNGVENLEEINENLQILIEFSKKIRNFKAVGIESYKLFNSYKESKNLLSQINKINQIQDFIGHFDYYMLPLFSDDLSTGFNKEIMYKSLIDSNVDISKIKLPFSDVLKEQLIKDALSGGLKNNHINFKNIYYENRHFIDYISSINFKYDKKVSDQHHVENFDVIFRYLVSKSSIMACNNFVEHFGDKVSQEVYIYCLSYLIACNASREKLFTYSVLNANMSDEQLNLVLQNYVDSFSGYKSNNNKLKSEEVGYFLNLFGDRITEKTLDYLVHSCIKWSGWNNEELLNILVNFGCDIGEALINAINFYTEDGAEDKSLFFLEKHKSVISQLQLDEALLCAFNNKFFNLCKILIDHGANENKIKFHSQCYGRDLWIKESGLKFSRAYWRSKDYVIISEILKELGNPQDKVKNIIHVTGSNGKGSVCAFLRSIIEEHGSKVNVFTSPSVVRDNENIYVQGNEIDDESYFDYLKIVTNAYNNIKDTDYFKNKIKEANEKDRLSEKEAREDGMLQWSFIIPLMVLAFSKKKADFTIIEVITGGEFDLTNIFTEKNTVATIVNSIIFGDNHAGSKGFENLESVAYTKSRLSKKNIPIICAKQQNVVLNIIKEVANDRESQLLIEDKDWKVEIDDKYLLYKGFGSEFKVQRPNLVGNYQISNIGICISVLLNLKKAFKLFSGKISKAVGNSHNIGRFSLLKNVDQKVFGKYQEVYFGSLKTSIAIKDFLRSEYKKVGNNFDIIFIPSADHSYLYALEYLDNSIFLNAKNKVFISNYFNNSASHKYFKYLETKIAKIKDLKCKNNIASAISLLASKSDKKRKLFIFGTGVSSFDYKNVALLYSLQNKSYKKDLDFAYKNSSIQKNQYVFLNNSKEFDHHEYLLHSRENYFEKYYISAAKELNIKINKVNNKLEFVHKKDKILLSYADFEDINSEYQKNLFRKKDSTNQIAKLFFDIPITRKISYKEDLSIETIKDDIAKAVVIKPNSGAFSHDVYHVNHNSENSASKLEFYAQKIFKTDSALLVQEYIDGDEFRVFFIGNKVIYLVKKSHPVIIGDGNMTISEQIDSYNKRTIDSSSTNFNVIIPKIHQNDILEQFLEFKGYLINSILEKGTKLELNFGGLDRIFIRSNIKLVPDDILENISNFTKKCEATFGCIDFIVKDNKWYFLEANSAPGVQQYYKKDSKYYFDHDLAKTILQELFKYKQKKLSNEEEDKESNIANFYNKRFLLDSYNLDCYTADEYNFVVNSLGNLFAKKEQISVIDYGCGDGRSFKIFQDYLKNSPNKKIKYYGCDISLFGLQKFKEHLIEIGFKDNTSNDRVASLLSQDQRIEIKLLDVEKCSFKDVTSILPKSDILISLGMVSHILGKNNRTSFYKFCSKISDIALHVVAFHDFEHHRKYYEDLRSQKESSTKKDKIKEINSILGDALEKNEFYYNAGEVRGYSQSSPEDKSLKIPFVTFPDEKILREELESSNPKEITINYGKSFSAINDWCFIETKHN
ncbi:MAG: hypothetical protein ISQ34_03375 [Rickettsiales bacterium]|nr:hypothetical protein [Rickettsiales bacterium]